MLKRERAMQYYTRKPIQQQTSVSLIIVKANQLGANNAIPLYTEVKFGKDPMFRSCA